jgi:hypothetical protein
MYCAYSIRKNNYRLPFDCYCGAFSIHGSRHEASNIPEQRQTRPPFRADNFAPIILRRYFLRSSIWRIGWRIVWRLYRIKLRQSLRHATGHDKLKPNPKFRAHHQCDHLP